MEKQNQKVDWRCVLIKDGVQLEVRDGHSSILRLFVTILDMKQVVRFQLKIKNIMVLIKFY